MQQTKINWTDQTWNPVSGCSQISAGCRFCYAETLAERRRGTPAFPNGFDVMLRPWKLREPLKLKEPSLVFTNSMSDLFHKLVPDSYRDQILEVISVATAHRFQILTKRPEKAAAYFANRPVPANVWLGVTVEHQITAHRIDTLRSIAARVRFLSVEPLIGRVDLSGRLKGIHWVIGGGESGSHISKRPRLAKDRAIVRPGKAGEPRWVLREDRVDWARALRDACAEQRVAFWWKQNGGPKPESAGRLLDGRTWDEMPVHVPSAMPENWR